MKRQKYYDWRKGGYVEKVDPVTRFIEECGLNWSTLWFIGIGILVLRFVS